MTIQQINIGTNPNDSTGDDPRTVGQKLNSNFTTASHAASRDVGTATGEIPTADDLGIIGNVNWNSGNLQPEGGLSSLQIPKLFRKVGGGSVAAGATVSGGDLRRFFVDAAGNISTNADVPVGTYRNTSGREVLNLEYDYFVRVL